ncbi:hypothetical protein [Tabrizicola sp.]|uniref:hypothetical protein n=1 Tax=Tabrizicola sp. TaxID=2005166 RepID=UPI003F309E38
MPTTLAYKPGPEDFDEDFFGIPVLSWRPSPEPEEAPVTPPLPERPTVAPVAAR